MTKQMVDILDANMTPILDNFLEGVTWITVFLAVAVCLLIWVNNDWLSMPPGPVGLPYFGYYPFLRSDYHLQLSEMRKTYGDVFLIKCTGQLYVHLPNLKTIKEAHVTKAGCFVQRPTNFTLYMDFFGDGVGFTSGENWRVLKKFFSQKLKECSLEKRRDGVLLGDGLQRTVDALEKSEGRNFEAVDFFARISTDIIRHMLLSGVSVDEGDLQRLGENIKFMEEMKTKSHVLLAGPLLKYVLVHIIPEFRKFRKCKFGIQSTLRKIVRQREKQFDKNNIQNLIDCYINERKSLEEKGDRKSNFFSESSLIYTLMQFFSDGSLSIGIFIAAILQELSNRPEVQREIQRELDEVVGRHRFPSLDDKCRTPYTNAVMQEIIRTGDFFFPVFPSLECTKETTIDGCRIPKGTVTLVNKWSTLRDPNLYENPRKFDPTRFLQNADKKPKSQVPVVFGIGKRSCMGESLVHTEIFLFVATTVHNFDLRPAKKDPSVVSRAEKNWMDMNMAFCATRRPH